MAWLIEAYSTVLVFIPYPYNVNSIYKYEDLLYKQVVTAIPGSIIEKSIALIIVKRDPKLL